MHRTVTLAWGTPGELRSLLHRIAAQGRTPRDLRANAGYWSGAIRRRMDARDVQTVAWLLLSASGVDALPSGLRRSARGLATTLEARL